MASDMSTIVVIGGVLVGVVLRSLLPYLKKLSEAEQLGQKISFKPKYIATMFLTVILGIFTAVQILSLIDIPEITDVQNGFAVFMFAVVFAYGFQSTLNLIADYEKKSTS